MMPDELHPVARHHLKRNFILGVANGALFSFGDALQDINLVLSVFISRLSGSGLFVGFLQPVRLGGWFLPQLLVSCRLQSARAKMPYYRIGAACRVFGAFGVAISAFLVRDSHLLLALTFLMLAIFSLSGGLSGLAFTEVVAKTIPSRMRGSYSAWRIFTGGILAFAGSFIVRRILGGALNLSFPINYALLFLLAAFGIGIAMAAYAFTKEPTDGKVQPPATLREQLRRASALPARNPNYRNFLLARICLMLAEIAAPFYIIYAKTILGLPDSISGTYLMVSTAANILSTYAWGHVSDGVGNRTVLRAVCFIGGIAPLLTLGMSPLLSHLRSGTWLPLALFGAVFALLGAARTGITIGALNFLLDVAPAHDRAIYIGLTNTLVGIATLSTALGGVIAEVFGYRALFTLAFILYLVASLAISHTREPRESGDS